MSEDHEQRISLLMENLLIRLEFEVKNQQPNHLPPITQAVCILNDYKTGAINGSERHMVELNLIKNINNQIRNFKEGGENGGDKQPS